MSSITIENIRRHPGGGIIVDLPDGTHVHFKTREKLQEFLTYDPPDEMLRRALKQIFTDDPTLSERYRNVTYEDSTVKR